MKVWCDAPAKIVLVGQAPSRETDGEVPFSGRSGRRIAELIGIRHAELGDRFALANVFDSWPGPSPHGKGDAFPMAEARLAAERMQRRLVDRRLVFFGASVAKAFGHDPREILLRFSAAPGYQERLAGGAAVAYVPHPSGVNAWWNDPANEAQARRFLRSLTGGENELRGSVR